ncbi:MAG TPA: Do family serine endopeptidase [Geminicoccus sp.]|jgi:serine protease Do|uniref:Do family serine endopeptidase n=1 Tax=Geminicoccus sp. TaxID=2024832 RepID=UPI002E320D2B|nr:Do family serine endopeptidase [Geminicoccus sp.]HEX2526797.1 Do family serine endopeptidase [Geminicoccus sp.]
MRVSTLPILLALAMLALAVPAPAQEQRRVPTSVEEVRLSFAPVVRRAAPAVVNIQTSREVAARRQPYLSDPLLEFFFGRNGPGRPPERQRVENSLGSGVMLRPDGVVVTNNHVIEGADQITVILADRRAFEATLLSRDERADLAFLKIDTDGETLPTLPLARSDALQVGDLVLAIGNPFGIGQTVTSGIVSATNRTAEGLERDVSFIQTDAAINPGNSGGALVDLEGRLVGINTAIFSRSGGSIGIGFAIPADLVRVRLESVVAGTQEVSRPWLGAALQSVDVGMAESLGLARPQGVLVGKIWPGGPADEAGLRTGDVILSVDGVAVDDPASFGYRLSLQQLGTRARLGVFRRGKERTVQVERAEAPQRPAPDLTAFPANHPLGGATAANMSPGFNERLGLDPFETGVVIVAVERGSRAAYMNLEVGDMIVAINDEEVETVDELQSALPRRGRPFAMTVKSGGRLYQFRVGS